ncbi:uncharacterized protein CTRU02_202095 [Colletotrichum truncatum]|uniref:Uncharacterized protein n=1 Tax=Colletotrichum truncatum TaxID=5467 RepID=A0ACC3ZJS1_COLTU|nr:uncharacterized protein CTRU02_14281 [Colletotrichum truncatum]KAF6782388.1 hypothetical protein CTRU02_14281 [Colletotrichum truncatum]
MSQSQHSRKRSASAMSLSDNSDADLFHLPRDSINPLSHTASVLHQLRLAGLSETDQPPSREQPKFPHRAWQNPDVPTRHGVTVAASAKPLESDSDEQEQRDLDEERKPRSRKKDGEKKARYASEKQQFRPLVRAIYGFLDKGDVANAKRAFGILVRSHVYGKPVDIRRNNYWALGAEILMREGDGRESRADESQEVEAYPAENILRVREYFQDLIQRYPYNFKYRNAVSAVDFWPALLSYEVYQVHTQQTASLRRLEREVEDWEDDSWQEPHPGSGIDEMMDDTDMKAEIPVWQADARDRRLRQARDLIRVRTLDGLRQVASRMDDLLEDRPYSTKPELLRLRGMVSLYMGDLLIPACAQTEGQMAEAKVRREAERNNALSSFQRMIEYGGRPDAFVQGILAPTEEDTGPLLPIFSSLPIREYRTAS